MIRPKDYEKKHDHSHNSVFIFNSTDVCLNYSKLEPHYINTYKRNTTLVKDIQNPKFKSYEEWLDNQEDTDVLNKLRKNINYTPKKKSKSILTQIATYVSDFTNCNKTEEKKESVDLGVKTHFAVSEIPIVKSKNSVFNVIHKCKWYDVDEYTNDINVDKRNTLMLKELSEYIPELDNLASQLNDSISQFTPLINNLEPKSRNNFLYHVLSKGENMFTSILTDYTVCLYLLDTYDNLYDVLHALAKRPLT